MARRSSPRRVLDRFDVIGMDPRGTGTSTPVRCDLNVWNEDVSQFPNDEAGFAQLRAHTEAIGRAAFDPTGPPLGHLYTVSAATRWSKFASPLGGEPLNYLGLSYGTQLGCHLRVAFP